MSVKSRSRKVKRMDPEAKALAKIRDIATSALAAPTNQKTPGQSSNHKRDFETINSLAAQIVSEQALIGDTEMSPSQRDPIAIAGRMKDKAHNIEIICGKYLSGATVGDIDVTGDMNL